MSVQHKLLLADDSLTIQKVVELVLAHENFNIRAVNNGEQALEALEAFAPDVILADIEMPKLNGYQLCEKVKNNAATVHVPVILLAGAFEPFDEEYAKAVGADDYIIKPFESQELISKVKSLLISSGAPQEPAGRETSIEESPELEETLSEGVSEIEGGPDSLSSPFAEEPKWDEDIPVVTDVRTDEQELIDEEYEAKIALSAKGFAEELTEALKEERAPAAVASIKELAEALELPSKEDISGILRQDINEKISALISSDLAPDLSSIIKDAVVQAISGIAPGIVEEVTREAVKDLLHQVKGEVNAAIGRIVPEIAETVIKKEIEKITSEL